MITKQGMNWAGKIQSADMAALISAYTQTQATLAAKYATIFTQTISAKPEIAQEALGWMEFYSHELSRMVEIVYPGNTDILNYVMENFDFQMNQEVLKRTGVTLNVSVR